MSRHIEHRIEMEIEEPRICILSISMTNKDVVAHMSNNTSFSGGLGCDNDVDVKDQIC